MSDNYIRCPNCRKLHIVYHEGSDDMQIERCPGCQHYYVVAFDWLPSKVFKLVHPDDAPNILEETQ